MLQQLTKSWPLGGMLQQYDGFEFARSLPRSPQAATVDQNLVSWRHARAISWLRVRQKFAKLPSSCNSWPKTGLLEACYGNIMALSLPKVCQDRPKLEPLQRQSATHCEWRFICAYVVSFVVVLCNVSATTVPCVIMCMQRLCKV